MGADIKALRNRIKSVDSTLHLTKAMGLVASSKIRRATEAMIKSRQYADSLENIIGMLVCAPECKKSPFVSKAGERIELIVIAGDRGLAGGYNANVFRMVNKYHDAQIIPIGKRACERYGKEIVSSEKFSGLDSYKLAKKLCDDFILGKYDRLGIIGTQYISMMKQETYIRWVLPIIPKKRSNTSSVLFEPDEITILNTAIPEYIAGIISSVIKESFTSELVARRMAMDSAGKNAQEMIDSLKLSYNRARQSAITQEITEIIAGS